MSLEVPSMAAHSPPIDTNPGVRARLVAVELGLERIIGEVSRLREIAVPLRPDVVDVEQHLKDARYVLADALREVRLTIEAHREAAGR